MAVERVKVSVIVPNYNHGNYLRQRIESILQQTYRNFEIIILDDCSTDNSRDVIMSYRSHPAVAHIEFNKVNGASPFKQWQKGTQLARGEFIWIAESDDYADDYFLEVMMNAFQGRPNLGLVYCDSHIVIQDTVQPETFAMRKNRKLNTQRWDFDYVNRGIDEIQDFFLAYGTINNTSAVLFRREMLERASPFDINFRFIGDKYTFIRILAIADVGYISKSLSYYRASLDSKPKHTTDYLDYFYEEFKVFDWVNRNLKSIERNKFLHAFQLNTENSLLRGWNKKKAGVYVELMMLNKKLFAMNLFFNFVRSAKKLFPKSL